tara:strand:+ start:392 stop:607 length:216 start_codon:yes stop_codon:yes gene_type:complete
MTNTLIEHLEGLVKNHQERNRRNAPRIGRAVGRISNMFSSLKNRTNITESERITLLKDLEIVQDNLNEIEL